MPTAPDAVSAVARYVAPPLAEEGAAQVIERLALSGSREAAAASRALAGAASAGREGVAAIMSPAALGRDRRAGS